MKLHFQNVPFTSSSIMPQTACFPVLKTLCAIHLLSFCQFVELKMIPYLLLKMHCFLNTRKLSGCWLRIFLSCKLPIFFANFVLFSFYKLFSCWFIGTVYIMYVANINVFFWPDKLFNLCSVRIQHFYTVKFVSLFL